MSSKTLVMWVWVTLSNCLDIYFKQQAWNQSRMEKYLALQASYTETSSTEGQHLLLFHFIFHWKQNPLACINKITKTRNIWFKIHVCVYEHLNGDFISVIYHQLSQYSSKSWSAQPRTPCDKTCEELQANRMLYSNTFSFISFKMVFFQFHSKLSFSSTIQLNRSAILVLHIT